MRLEAETDPRIRRTRQMLFQALQQLLTEKGFDEITVQDIADRSTVNRGTIYAHYDDKFALLAALVDEQFRAIFELRMQGTSGTCSEGVKQLILAVCDFMRSLISADAKNHRPFQPIVESTVRTIVRNFLLDGLRHDNKSISCAEAELRATAASWAICGTVVEWSRARTTSAEELAKAVLPLVAAGLLLPEGTVEKQCAEGKRRPAKKAHGRSSAR